MTYNYERNNVTVSTTDHRILMFGNHSSNLSSNKRKIAIKTNTTKSRGKYKSQVASISWANWQKISDEITAHFKIKHNTSHLKTFFKGLSNIPLREVKWNNNNKKIAIFPSAYHPRGKCFLNRPSIKRKRERMSKEAALITTNIAKDPPKLNHNLIENQDPWKNRKYQESLLI